jgi:hypothetical protein
VAIYDYSTSPKVFVPSTVQTVIIGGDAVRYGQRQHGGWFIKHMPSGDCMECVDFATVRWFLMKLREKHEPEPTPALPAAAVVLRQDVAVAAVAEPRILETIIRVPDVQAVDLGVCDGFLNAHWNLPKVVQKTHASERRIGKNLCPFCAAEYDKALAHTVRLLVENNTASLNYVPVEDIP